METTIYTVQGKEKGKISLPGIFETKVSSALLHEVVNGYMANQRSGTHSTKTRAEVSGGGRKPWKEKGTGNARAGSNRSPLWRKGGIIFGPKPRDYSRNVPQQKRQLSLKMALSVKASSNDIMVVDSFAVAEPKTKKLAELLKNLKLNDMSVLIVVEKIDANLKVASRNLQDLWAKKTVFTSSAIELLNNKTTVNQQA